MVIWVGPKQETDAQRTWGTDWFKQKRGGCNNRSIGWSDWWKVDHCRHNQSDLGLVYIYIDIHLWWFWGTVSYWVFSHSMGIIHTYIYLYLYLLAISIYLYALTTCHFFICKVPYLRLATIPMGWVALHFVVFGPTDRWPSHVPLASAVKRQQKG